MMKTDKQQGYFITRCFVGLLPTLQMNVYIPKRNKHAYINHR